MQVETRSKAAAAAPTQATATPQQAPATLDDSVDVNWVFFDPPRPSNRPVPIVVPWTLFSAKSHHCRRFFVTALLKEFGFEADESTIAFWTVSGIYFLGTL